jgi:TPR repeat protein
VALRVIPLAALAFVLAARLTADGRAAELEDGNAAFDAGHYQDARRLWSAAAESGNAQAAFDLGLLYDLGEGVPPNTKTAFQWYRRAAEEGLGAAAFNVGVMYDSGRGAPLDRAEAAIWYARAAVLGEARAAYNLGQLYEWGEGVPQNIQAAIAWYGAAAAAIPEAARKASDLAKQSPVARSGPLVAPVPVWPAAGIAIPSAAPVQLVWTAPAQPSPVSYYAEVQALENGRFNEVVSDYATVSAIAVTLPDDKEFAWRVYAVAANGSAYASSPWMRFDKVSPEQAVPSRAPSAVSRPGTPPPAAQP